jgi:hypothetical protein
MRESLASKILAEFERRKLRPRIATRYPVRVKNQQLVFSFGYRRVEGPKHEVVVEAVDLTAETFYQRVRALAPASVKFEMAKSHRKTLEALCLLQLPGSTPTVTNGEFGLEMETLRRHADGVFNFDDATQRGRFMKKVEADLRQ